MKKDGIIEKLKKIKGIGYIGIALIAGIALIFLGGEKETENVPADRGAEFVTREEARLRDMGRDICGVECTAAVYAASGYTYSYAEDQSLKTVYNADGTVAEREVTLTNRTVNTDGGTALVPIKENTPSVKGVAMVCVGASEADMSALKSLIMALYSLKEDAVFVTN